MVDKYYFIKGGAERYYFELTKVLEKNGHQVIPFSMQHPDNFKTLYAPYFVENIEFNDLSPLQKISKAPKILERVIYSITAKNAISRLIEETTPDIAHLHMIDHQLSPSILHVLQAYNIPIIQTCHQYKLVCPSYRLFVARTNQVCEKCITGKNYHAILERCHKNSLASSALIAVESYIHKWMKVYDAIDVFHVPSRFLGDRLIDGGFPENKIWHSFYTINLDDYPYHPDSADYIIYYGRLSEEKGVGTLLEAMNLLPEVELRIVGDGPQRQLLEKTTREKRLQNVRFCGNQSNDDLLRLVQNSKFVVVPSEWYDNSPLVIYEAFSMGKPVIATMMGGMPELVENGLDGYLFASGDVQTLVGHIRNLWANAGLRKKMGEKARQKAEREFSPKVHYGRILELYEGLTASKRLRVEFV
jgi:glycosyltransferase involved in cell wall biosynthesis